MPQILDLYFQVALTFLYMAVFGRFVQSGTKSSSRRKIDRIVVNHKASLSESLDKRLALHELYVFTGAQALKMNSMQLILMIGVAMLSAVQMVRSQ